LHVALFGAAIVAAVAAGLIKWLLPGGIVVPPVPLGAWAALLGNARIYPLVGVSLVSLAATFSLYAYIAPFLQDMLGIGPQGLSWLLFLFGATSLAANAVLGVLTARVGQQRLFLMSMVLLLLTLALTRFTEGRVWLIVLLFATWAISSAFFATLQQARVVEAAPASAPALLALNTSAFFAGQAVGAMVGGWVLGTAGLHALPWTGAALAALAIVVFALSRGTKL
jgi:predicted MFS family arabinose efflux permease